jgi:acyl-CoA thioester hydrolase
MQEFTTTLRVRHYEMDALGHVNNAVYLHYLEQAAIEHSEHAGFTLKRYRKMGGVFVLRKLEIDYRSSAVAGDTLVIKTWVEEMRGPRTVRRYEIRNQADNSIVATAQALWAWVDLKTQRPRSIPRDLIDAFKPQLASLPEPVPLKCSKCATPLELKGSRPLRQEVRPDLFGGQHKPIVSREQVDVYMCSTCGQEEIFLDSEQSDLDD